MLQIWDAIEADFLRDYRIDLMEQIDRMTWRRFLVLMSNLSPSGAVAVRIRSEVESGKTEDTETDEAAANAFFSSVVAMGG